MSTSNCSGRAQMLQRKGLVDLLAAFWSHLALDAFARFRLYTLYCKTGTTVLLCSAAFAHIKKHTCDPFPVIEKQGSRQDVAPGSKRVQTCSQNSEIQRLAKLTSSALSPQLGAEPHACERPQPASIPRTGWTRSICNTSTYKSSLSVTSVRNFVKASSEDSSWHLKHQNDLTKIQYNNAQTHALNVHRKRLRK